MTSQYKELLRHFTSTNNGDIIKSRFDVTSEGKQAPLDTVRSWHRRSRIERLNYASNTEVIGMLKKLSVSFCIGILA